MRGVEVVVVGVEPRISDRPSRADRTLVGPEAKGQSLVEIAACRAHDGGMMRRIEGAVILRTD